jgi:predicted nucleotidyltransferase
MEPILDDQMKEILSEISDLMLQTYGNILKAVILYGSVAKGTQTSDSDIDIIVLIDGDQTILREYEDKLCDVSTDISLKYLKVFSIIDISYQEYQDWLHTSPFYKNISEEGVVLYAA